MSQEVSSKCKEVCFLYLNKVYMLYMRRVLTEKTCYLHFLAFT